MCDAKLSSTATPRVKKVVPLRRYLLERITESLSTDKKKFDVKICLQSLRKKSNNEPWKTYMLIT